MLGNFGALKIWIPELGFSVFFRNLSPDWRYVCFPTSCIYKSGHSGLKMDTSTRGSADADLTVCVTNTSDSPLGTLWSTQQTFRIKAVWLIWYGNTNTLNVSLFAKKKKKAASGLSERKAIHTLPQKTFFPSYHYWAKYFHGVSTIKARWPTLRASEEWWQGYGGLTPSIFGCAGCFCTLEQRDWGSGDALCS